MSICLLGNVYEAVKSKAGSNVSAEEQTAADAKAKLERYQFYFERTLEYDKSIAAAVRSLPETERRMELLQNFTSGTLADVEFLANANKTVIECRRALKWSYVVSGQAFTAGMRGCGDFVNALLTPCYCCCCCCV